MHIMTAGRSLRVVLVTTFVGTMFVAQATGEQVDATWEAQEPLPEVRTEVSATTDGTYIYLAGGFGPPQGDQRASAPRTVWRYDPQADLWSVLTALPEGVNHAPFQYHDGRLYVLGGYREHTFDPIDTVRIYDLETEQWEDGAPMPTARGASGWTVLDGRIHVLGGNAPGPEAIADQPGARIGEDRSVNVHEAYDPATDSWESLAPMPTPRNHLGAAAHNGRIHAVLGRLEGDFTLTTHEIYDAETDTWEVGPDVPTGRSGVAVLEHGGYVYTFGGETFGGEARTFDDAERYSPDRDHWEQLPPMPTARHGLGGAAVGGAIYVISGGPEPGFSFGDMNERLEVEQ